VTPHPRRVAIVGGSLMGLLAGNLLHRAGHDVTILERSAEDLEGRGAGITILPGLVSSFRAAGIDESEASLGVPLPRRAVLDLTGSVIAEREYPQAMTSWGRLYEALRRVFPDARYRVGAEVVRVVQEGSRIEVVLAGDGGTVEADIVVGADGLRSSLRRQFMPDLQPHYAGYVAWRCLVDEADLPEPLFAPMMSRYTLGATPGEQVIGYPVPGPTHSKAIGGRQFNVVWYHPVREGDEMRAFLTDDDGGYHPRGISPGLLSRRTREGMIDIARRKLPPPFALALERARLHFFQPILDIVPDRLVFGRCALIGDAAFVARPHTAMGVPKGAGDAVALVRALEDAADDPTAALAEFETARLRIGRAIVRRGRSLGAYMEAQVGTAHERLRAEESRSAEELIAETAAPIDYDVLARANA